MEKKKKKVKVSQSAKVWYYSGRQKSHRQRQVRNVALFITPRLTFRYVLCLNTGGFFFLLKPRS